MRAIAPRRYRLAPVSDNPAPKRLLRTRSSDTCWSSWKKDTFEPVKQRFRDVVNVESGFALIEIDNQNREVMIRRSSLCLQAFAGGARATMNSILVVHRSGAPPLVSGRCRRGTDI